MFKGTIQWLTPSYLGDQKEGELILVVTWDDDIYAARRKFNKGEEWFETDEGTTFRRGDIYRWAPINWPQRGE